MRPMHAMILRELAGQVDLGGTRRAWKRFVESGELDAGSVRPHVARAWRRSAAGGCDPQILRAEGLSPEGTAARIELSRALIEAARPFMSALSRAAGADRHAVMLGDEGAHVLVTVGDEASVRGPESVPSPGSLLSEGTSGANGIGSPLAEDGYVELVGPEHFIEGFHAFTCQGISLRGPAAETVGVLSMSVRRLETADRVRDVLFCSSQAVECELLAGWLTEALLAAGPRVDLAERLRQDIVQGLSAVHLRITAAAQRLARGGDAGAVLATAEGLIRKFRRQAAVWRDMVSAPEGEPEVIALVELVEGICDLLTTEVRVGELTLEWGAALELRVLADRRELSQRLLGEFLTVMQAAGQGGQVLVAVEVGPKGQAVVELAGTNGTTGARLIRRVPVPRVC